MVHNGKVTVVVYGNQRIKDHKNLSHRIGFETISCLFDSNRIIIQGGLIKCYHFSIIPKFSNVNLFKIFIQRFVIRNIKPIFNINEFVKSELCRERNKDLCSVCI